MKILKNTILLCAILALSSCKEKHSIRLTNNYIETVSNMYAGNAFIGTVDPGSTSGYKSIDAGNFQITANLSSGSSLSGAGSVTGKGTHRWTLVLSEAGTLSVRNDK